MRIPSAERDTDRALALLSGGIDSPVAAWMLMRSGIHTDMIHFHSYPFSCSAAIEKAKELSSMLLPLQGGGTLFLVPFLELQERVLKNTEPRLRIVLYKRAMLRIAELIAISKGVSLLATGDSLGQVSSQTLHNISAVEGAVKLPVMRPLIGFDKTEIIDIAKSIGTFSISIRPHEDCCTLFSSGRPSTRSEHAELRGVEEKLNLDALMHEVAERCESVFYPAPGIK